MTFKNLVEEYSEQWQGNNRILFSAQAEEIIKTWKDSPAIRAEFGIFNKYRAYAEAMLPGK